MVKEKGLAFDLEPADIVIPARCPLLDIPIEFRGRTTHAGSPSLDRIVPALGYVKGNVWVISYKANTIKSDATPAEIKLLADRLLEKTSHC